MSRAIEILTRDHKTLLRVADVLDSMSRETEDRAQLNPEDVNTILRTLRLFGDYVQDKEEGALFPIFSKACDVSQYAAVRRMLFEHEQERSLVEGMEDAFRCSNAYQFAEYSSRLAALLRGHVYREENLLFDTIGGSLSSTGDVCVVREFADYDREFRKHEQEVMQGLHILQSKYVGHAA